MPPLPPITHDADDTTRLTFHCRYCNARVVRAPGLELVYLCDTCKDFQIAFEAHGGDDEDNEQLVH